MPRTMRAAVLVRPGEVLYDEVPVPLLDSRDVLIEVRAAGNCGSDLKRIMVEGTHVLPCIPGHEFAGVVAAVGTGVSEWRIGDRVTAAPMIPCLHCEWCLSGQYNMCDDYDYVGSRSDGAFADYVKIPAANVVKLPDGIQFEDAAMTDPACVALHAVRRARGVEPGEIGAVLGAGPIGMFVCQWLKLLGAAAVVAVDIVPEKLEIARSIGADVVVDASSEDPVARILSASSNRGADIVFETAGTLETHVQALQCARKRGRVVHIGRAYRDMLLPDDVFTKIFRRELTVIGAVNSNFSMHDHEWKTVVEYLGGGRLATKPLISHRLPMEAVGETFRKMFTREITYNKIIFSPEGKGGRRQEAGGR